MFHFTFTESNIIFLEYLRNFYGIFTEPLRNLYKIFQESLRTLCGIFMKSLWKLYRIFIESTYVKSLGNLYKNLPESLRKVTKSLCIFYVNNPLCAMVASTMLKSSFHKRNPPCDNLILMKTTSAKNCPLQDEHCRVLLHLNYMSSF